PQAGGGMCNPFPDLPGFCVFPAGAFPPFSWKQPEAHLLRQIAWKGFDLIDGFHRIRNIEQIPTNRSSLDGMRFQTVVHAHADQEAGDTRRDNSAVFFPFPLSPRKKSRIIPRPSPRRGRAGGFSLFQMISLLALDGTPDIVLQY
ncbi:MAG: hypothetical protein C0P67_015500, partial [Bacillota bacterium]